MLGSRFAEDATGLESLSDLPQVTQQVSSSKVRLTPSSLQLQYPRPSPQRRGWRLSLQDFSQSKKMSSPLIADFITHETAGLGRKKIASWLRPVPFQKDSTGWASCQPV